MPKNIDKNIVEPEGGFRTPSDDAWSDFNQAKSVSKGIDWKNEDVKHLHACIFGEKDGPDWIWILEMNDGSFGHLKAGCDYTGWDCQASGSYTGGFKSADDAIGAIPADYSFDEGKRALLTLQSKGMKPYGLA